MALLGRYRFLFVRALQGGTKRSWGEWEKKHVDVVQSTLLLLRDRLDSDGWMDEKKKIGWREGY